MSVLLVRPFRFLFGSLRRLSHNPRFHNLAFPYVPTFHVGSAACLIICVLPRGACLAVAGDSAGGCSFWLATIDEAQGDDDGGGAVAGARDWKLRGGVPVGGRLVSAAYAGERSCEPICGGLYAAAYGVSAWIF